MATIITAALLERFFVATSWCIDEHWIRRGRDGETDWSLHMGDPALLRQVAHADGTIAYEVAARLGLCAAAEDRIIAAEEYRKAAAGMTQAGHLVESKLAITLAEAADDAAARFLEMAGVSRERWDAARKRGS